MKPCETNSECQSACDAGDAPSCTKLAKRYDEGKGVTADPDKAKDLFDRACLKKDPEGCYQLALGWGNDAEKLENYANACDAGWAEACTNLGARYGNGKGVTADPVRARELAEKACKGGDSMGCANLGLYLRDGMGGPKDLPRAATVLRQACDASEGPACNRLASMYDNGTGMPEDNAVARKIYTRACDLDAATGCNDLGVMYDKGEGGDVDLDKAKALFEKACKLEDSMGCVNLGRFWRDGRVRGDVNLARAAELFDQACKAGEDDGCQQLNPTVEETRKDCEKTAKSCTNWGYLTEYGIGTTASTTLAMKLYEKGCTAKSPIGCRNLAIIYRDGKEGTVTVDKKKAVTFFDRSCKLGNDDSCQDAAALRGP